MRRLLVTFVPLAIVLLFCSERVIGQAITSIDPSSVYPGQKNAGIEITGVGTSFASGKTTVDMGSEITVTGISVQNSETILVIVNVLSNAIAGSYNVVIKTATNMGNQIVTRPAGITVIAQGGPVRATILVNPVQSIRLADLNPTNIAHSPLLFTITLYNNNVMQDLTVITTLTGEKLGLIATGTKYFKSLSANAIETFDNRQFDKYTLADINNASIEQAIETGTLPSDIYEYHVEVLSRQNIVASADGTNTIINPQDKPQLISPGSPLYSDPPLVKTRFPVFNWFCHANSFTFNLYEVNAGQISSSEIILNRPNYTISNIYSTSLIYPSSAALLEDGHTYAWQIIANYATASGSSAISSDLFWFTTSTDAFTEKTQRIAELIMSPNELTLVEGQSFQFHVKAIDRESDSVPMEPTWRVVPADGGTVDQNGYFTAGAQTLPVAVVATFHGMFDFATVNIIKQGKGKADNQDSDPTDTASPYIKPK